MTDDMTNEKKAQLSDEQILERAHRRCSSYKHNEAPDKLPTYTFLPHHLLDFARALLAASSPSPEEAEAEAVDRKVARYIAEANPAVVGALLDLIYTSPPVLQKSEAEAAWERFIAHEAAKLKIEPRNMVNLIGGIEGFRRSFIEANTGAPLEAEAAGTAGETRLPTKEEDAFLHRAAKAASKLVAPGRLASPSSAQGEQK